MGTNMVRGAWRLATALIVSVSLGCSTSGGIYSENDSEHGEFSFLRTILTGAALLGVAAAISKGGGGGGGYQPEDYEWDWDQFYNQYRTLVWACRGIQTGQFAEPYRCSGRYQTDSRWPDK
jgi:hypothetical protein